MTRSYTSLEEHFEILVKGMAPNLAQSYKAARCIRVEPVHEGRKFILYKTDGEGNPTVLDKFRIHDFVCDDMDGSSSQIECMSTGKILEVGYTPLRLWDHPVFLHLPLENKIRWNRRRNQEAGSRPTLSFLLVIRTQSRRHLQEPNIIYLESIQTFRAAFPNHIV